MKPFYILIVLNAIVLLNMQHLNAQYSTKYGTGALLNNTASHNTAFGYDALKKNTSGNYNTAIGVNALFSNITGHFNTASGRNALYSNTSGQRNTATGSSVLENNTTGSDNTATGYWALVNNRTGSYNTAIGANALKINTIGYNNTASGHSALVNNSSGYNNTANGFGTLVYNSTGFNNTAVGSYALFKNTTGSRNTAIGDSAGAAFNSTYSTFLGYKTDVTATGLTNVTVIGHRASATASNQVRIGNTSVTSIGGKVGWTTLSDSRFKKNISEEVPGLNFITSLRAVTYTLDIAALDKESGAEGQMSAEEVEAKAAAAREKHTGFIAQEVEEAAKKLNYDFSGVDKPKNSGDFYGLRYADFVVPLVKAVQELNARDKKLEEENRLKDERITKLEEELADLKQMVLELSKGNNSNSSNAFKAYLEGSTPNPTSGTALIRYYIPQNSGTANIVFTDTKGAIIRSITVSNKGTGQLNVNVAAWATGTYTYTLYVNGIQADSKKLVIAR